MADTFQTGPFAKSHAAPVVVGFWAPWGGPCCGLGPTVEKRASASGGRWRLDAHLPA